MSEVFEDEPVVVKTPDLDALADMWARWGTLAVVERAARTVDPGFGFDGIGCWRHDWGGSWVQLVPDGAGRGVLIGFDRGHGVSQEGLADHVPGWVRDAVLRPGLWWHGFGWGCLPGAVPEDVGEVPLDFISWYDGGSWSGVQPEQDHIADTASWVLQPLSDQPHAVAALLFTLGTLPTARRRELDFDLDEYVEGADMQPDDDLDGEYEDSQDLPQLQQRAELLLAAGEQRRLDAPSLTAFLHCVVEPDVPAGLALATELGLG